MPGGLRAKASEQEHHPIEGEDSIGKDARQNKELEWLS
jgi:hypothetical protein